MDEPRPRPRPLVARTAAISRMLPAPEPWRRPTALAVGAGGMLAAGAMFVRGVELWFSCLFSCTGDPAAVNDGGSLVVLAAVVAIATTICTQLTDGGLRWARMFGAWGALVLATLVYRSVSQDVPALQTTAGVAFIAVAAFLAVVLPIRDPRGTWLTLAGGLVVATLLGDHTVLGVALGLLPFLALQTALAYRPVRGADPAS